MNNEIVEEKKNNASKILIATIIILLVALGGLSYYTFFVRDKEVDKSNPVVEPTNPVAEPTINVDGIFLLNVFVKNEEILKEINKYDLAVTIGSYFPCYKYTYDDKVEEFNNLNERDRILSIISNIMNKHENNSINNVWFTSFATDDDNMRNDDALTDEEKEFYETNGFQNWMYINDFNKYALDTFKYVSPLKNNASYKVGKCSNSMETHNDKLFFGVGCGGCMGTPESVYTLLNKGNDTIELFETLYRDSLNNKIRDNKYTFKYNGTIYDLVKVEIIKEY